MALPTHPLAYLKKRAPKVKTPEPEEAAVYTDENDLQYVVIHKGALLYKAQPEDCDKLSSGWLTEEKESAELYLGDESNLCCYRVISPVKLLFFDVENLHKITKLLPSDDTLYAERHQTGKSIKFLLESAFLKHGKYRESFKLQDLEILKYMCLSLFKRLGYDGYYAPERETSQYDECECKSGRREQIERKGVFHRELALCNPEKFIQLCDAPVGLTQDDTLKDSSKSDSLIKQQVIQQREELDRSTSSPTKPPGSVKIEHRIYPEGSWHTTFPICKEESFYSREELPHLSDEDYEDYKKAWEEWCIGKEME